LTQPPGYRAPHEPARDRDQVMSDLTAQNLIAEIVGLHEELCARLDRDVELAAMGLDEPASGRVTGSGEHDQMEQRRIAVHQAEAERRRRRKNAVERLRRVVHDYEIELGRRLPRRPRVESIDYRGDGQRRVG
jgi:hypothetical protein